MFLVQEVPIGPALRADRLPVQRIPTTIPVPSSHPTSPSNPGTRNCRARHDPVGALRRRANDRWARFIGPYSSSSPQGPPPSLPLLVRCPAGVSTAISLTFGLPGALLSQARGTT